MLRSGENNCSLCCCDKKGAGKPALFLYKWKFGKHVSMTEQQP